MADTNWTCANCGNENYPYRDVCNRRTCKMPRNPVMPGPGNVGLGGLGGLNSMGGMPGVAGMGMGGMGGMIGMGGVSSMGGVPAQSNDWTCVFCNNQNFPFREVCNKRSCGRSRADSVAVESRALQGVMNNMGMSGWSSGSQQPSPLTPNPLAALALGGGLGDMSRPAKRQKTGGIQKPMWKCKDCGNDNFMARTHCNMRKCGAAKPEGADLWQCLECGNFNFPSRSECNMRRCKAARPASTQQKESKEENAANAEGGTTTGGAKEQENKEGSEDPQKQQQQPAEDEGVPTSTKSASPTNTPPS